MVSRWQRLSVIGIMLMAFAWKTAAATMMMGCHMGGMGAMDDMATGSAVAMPVAQPVAKQATSDHHADMQREGDQHHACDENTGDDDAAAKGQGHCSQCAPCSLGAMVSSGHATPATVKPQAPRVAAQGCADLSAVVLAFDRPPKRSA